MEPFSLIGIAILFLVVFLCVKIVVEYIKIIFMVLAVALLLIVYFHISSTDVVQWAGNALLWVL